ncbi:MAG: dihydrolipoyl dehydrogenase [candidate division WOR-3 bacterium]
MIGAGPAGYVAGIRLAQYGKKVVMVEEASVGGVCLNRGCIPVKALLHAAGIVRNSLEARGMGIVFGQPEIDLLSLGTWQRRIVERLRRGIEFLFKTNGVELIRGKAKLLKPKTVGVRNDNGEIKITAPKVIIATGSIPAVLPGLEPDHKRIIDSNSALNLIDLPRQIIIIGAGAIGLEFATIFQRLGSKVLVLEMCDSILPGVDKDITNLLQRQMEREGVEFHLGVKGMSCQMSQSTAGVQVCIEGKTPLIADKILVAAGRKANTAELGLEEVGIELQETGFIKTDRSFQTNVKGVYAIGDVRGGPMLAHKAMHEGLILSEKLAPLQNSELRTKNHPRAIPFVVYTDPEVAIVGLTESEAKNNGMEVSISKVPVSAVGRSLTLGRTEGLCKIIADRKTKKILGVEIVAPQADALIAEATLAVELGLTAEDLGKVVHPHPTMSELLWEASAAVLGKAIHIVNQ